MYAVIKSGGKQYKVAENEVIKIEKIDGEVGKSVKFDQVIAIGSDKGVEVGEPVIQGAVVSAEVLEQKKDDKIIIFKKKRRQNYRRKNGHRQQVTVVRIMDVSGKGEVKKAPTKKAAVKEEKPAVKADEKKEAAASKKTAEKSESASKKPAAKKDVGTPKKATKKED
ncbi:MAG: 50S ribosomal protein L21 [Alphaproteobacteria bacterium CG11_big_fil_rev_8_21_14_0_20_39_49]|nr:MAG: 50S ribosomal protein L21 [Alphaproteobacteria bacterium CG11_big_fil_rev_8_21_14_0_20_39_49]